MSDFFFRTKRSLWRRGDEFIRTHPLFRRWRIDRSADAETISDGSVTNLRIVSPADPHVPLGVTENDQFFLKVCKYYKEGWYARPNIFSCDVPDAYCHIGTGMICTRDWVALNESQLTYRMTAGPAAVGNSVYRPFRWFKPWKVRHISGTCATISNVYMGYWGHWIFDCLPRLYSLNQAAPGKKVTLLVADNWSTSWYDSLACALPPNFEVLRLPPDSWVQADRMILASYASSKANSHMPREFYEYVRQACFAKFGLSPENRPTERIYVSRAGTRHRRIGNEPELVEILRRYAFKVVALEKLNFREQVELFHRAEIIVAADGSNWADMMFAGRIKVFVLYSHGEPNTHWFTAAKGLGQDHYFWNAEGASQHTDFNVDPVAFERVLTEQMGLTKTAPK